MNWYYVLLLLYALLLGYYWWCEGSDVPRLNLWNPIDPPPTAHPSTSACTDSSDCPAEQLCHQGECIQKALRGGECNPATGDWVIEKDARGRKVATCMCRYPHLVTQKLKGGNCNVDVACAPHGRIKDWTTLDACECDEGYEPVPGRMECRRLTAVELQQLHKPPCDPDEDEYRNAVFYDYRTYSRSKKYMSTGPHSIFDRTSLHGPAAPTLV